ncbi:MAG: hemolysin family protein [Candidatus Krumholzibacteriia bacterium]
MGEDIGGQPGTSLLLLAAGAFLGAVLLAGMLTAFFRVTGLHRNGLLDEARLGPALRGYLAESRRFLVTVNTLYLALTLLGSFSWGLFLAQVWTTAAPLRFFAVFLATGVLGWSLGGLLVKMIAASTALTYARTVGLLIWPLHWLLRPWSAVMLAVMDRLDDTLWTGEAQPHLSAGEIRSLMNGDDPDVNLDEDEREMIHSIFSFQDTVVREIMVPRIDMAALEVNDSFAKAVETVNETLHSRIPVYEGSPDRVVGILYAKDLLALVQGDRVVTGDKTLADLLRPAYFIPESKKIDEVLDEFRTKRIHVAVVIDEYGGTAGLVTLEDVLEEIVGEIEDEFDVEEPLFAWVDERTLRVDPKIDLEDLEELLGIALVPEGQQETAETLGGLIYEAAGNVPDQGDRLQVGPLAITVEEVADQRILKAVLHAEQPLPGFVRQKTTP